VNHATAWGEAVKECGGDEQFWNEEFVSIVQKRGNAIIEAAGKASASSAAIAVCDHMHDWWYGTNAADPQEHRPVSMGVISDGNSYGVPAGLMFSFPLTCEGGEWKVVEGLEISEFSRAKLTATAAELCEERKMALGIE